MRILYTSFYTPEYTECAARLIESLDRFNLFHCVKELESRGMWVDNCMFKPTFILAVMNAAPVADAVVWLDADCVVRQDPVLFKGLDCDLAVCIRDKEVFGGTVYLKNNDKGRFIVKQWIKRCSLRVDRADQQALEHLWYSGAFEGLKLKRIPGSYAAIFDRQDVDDEAKPIVPVIEHFQHGREVKKIEGAK